MPRLVVADEIVSGLDVSVQAQVLNLLIELGRRHGIALVLISHDLSVVRYLCSRVVVMQHGNVVEQGNTEEVFANPQHPYTRLLLASVAAGGPVDRVAARDRRCLREHGHGRARRTEAA